MRKWKVIAMAIAGAALLFGATVINGDRSIVGRWDASNSTGTLPFQVGTAASLPATCTVGQIYFASDGINGRQIQKCAAANTWSAIVYDQGTVLPAACALGQIYFKTDATAGQNLYYCTGTNAWTQQLNSGGGGGATVNAGAGKGIWFPWGTASYSPGGNVVAPIAANRGWRYQFLVDAQIESRSLNAYIDTAASGASGLQFAVYDYGMSTRLAMTTVAVSGGTPDINVTGAAQFVWGSGSMVSGGVLTLPAGVYWLVTTSDSTTMKLASYGDARSVTIANATTTTSTLPSGLKVRYSNSAISTGTGGSLGLTADLSGIAWVNAATPFPIVAFVN